MSLTQTTADRLNQRHRDARSVEKYAKLGSAAIRAGLERNPERLTFREKPSEHLSSVGVWGLEDLIE